MSSSFRMFTCLCVSCKHFIYEIKSHCVVEDLLWFKLCLHIIGYFILTVQACMAGIPLIITGRERLLTTKAFEIAL